MELTHDLLDAVERYFSYMRHTGYKPYEEVYRLLVFMFIEEMLYGNMSGFISERDYKAIDNAITCISGTCMIPFIGYRKGIDGIYNDLEDPYRITESGILRSTETDSLRVKA